MAKNVLGAVGGGGLGIGAWFLVGGATGPTGWVIGGAILGVMAASREAKPLPGAEQASPTPQTLRSATASARYVLGRMYTGGVMSWAQEQKGDHDEGEWLHVVYVLSEGEIEEVEEIYINDTPIADYSSFIDYEVKINPAVSDGYLEANCADWRTSQIGEGLSWVRISYKFDKDKYAGGIPDVKFLLKGRNDIYDPRDATTAYSDNPALCLLWYMQNVLNVADDKIVTDSFTQSANICDEAVTNPDSSVSKRYTMGAVIADNESKTNVINKMLDSCGGKLNRVGGKWMLEVGAYYGTYDFTVTEDMVIGNINFQTEVDNADAVNTIAGTFNDLDALVESEFPQIQNTTWVTDDGGESAIDLRLPYVYDVYQAQRLADMQLKRRRTGGRFTVNMNFNGYNCRPGRIVRLLFESLNIDGEFIVTSWEMNSTEGCTVSFAEYNTDMFDDAVGSEYSPLPFITVSSTSIDAPTGLTWTPSYSGDSVQGSFSWTPPNGNIETYTVLVKLDGDLIQTYQLVGAYASVEIKGLDAGGYVFSVYAGSTLGQSGEASLSVNIEVPSVPAVVTFSNSIDSITIRPSNPVNGINGGYYNFWYATGQVVDVIADAEELGNGLSFTHSGLAFDTTYYYYIRSVNAYGKSDFYELVANTSDDVSAFISSLANQITSSELAQSLLDDIALGAGAGAAVSALETTVANLELEVDSAVASLNLDINALNSQIADITAAPDYDVNEASVNTGELRVYTVNDRLYRALSDMTDPIPVPTNTTFWKDLGEFTSISETVGDIQSDLTTLQGVVDGQAYQVLALSSERRDEDGGEGDLINALETYSNKASIKEEILTRTTETESLAKRLLVAESSYVIDRDDGGDGDLYDAINTANSNARFAEEVIVRSTADDALSQRITTLNAEYDETASELTSLQATVASANETFASDITTLSSRIDDNDDDISSTASAVSALTTRVSNNEGDITSISSDVTSLESRVTDTESDISGNASAISGLQTSVSSLEGDVTAIASDVTTLQSTVGDNSASIQTNANTIASTNGDLAATYTLKVQTDNNGVQYAAGMALGVTNEDGDAPVSQVTFLADEFSIMTDVDGSVQVPFIVSGGVVYIDNAFIANLTADNLEANNLSAIFADMGTITAGKMQSNDGDMVIDLDNKIIRITA